MRACARVCLLQQFDEERLKEPIRGRFLLRSFVRNWHETIIIHDNYESWRWELGCDYLVLMLIVFFLSFHIVYLQGRSATSHGEMGGKIPVCVQNVGQRVERSLGALPAANIRTQG